MSIYNQYSKQPAIMDASPDCPDTVKELSATACDGVEARMGPDAGWVEWRPFELDCEAGPAARNEPDPQHRDWDERLVGLAAV